jgi:uncharacterized membrane protein
VTRSRPDPVVAPTHTDPVARGLAEVAGGPVGRHARPHRWWTPLRVMLALATVVLALSVVHHVPCLETGWADDQARYGKGCYSDVPYLYTGRGLAEGWAPYGDDGGRHQAMEYPVGISYLAWGAAGVTLLVAQDGPGLEERRLAAPDAVWGLPGMGEETNSYFLVTAVLLGMLGLAAVWFLARTHRHRPWDALPFVLAPSLFLTGLVNWDLLAVALVAAALWAWERQRPVTAGIMVGLGTAAKLYPLFLLGPMLVLAVRRREPALFVRPLVAAVVVWVLVNAPAWLASRERWQVFWSFNADRGADLGSVWLALTHAGASFTPGTINTVSWVFFIGCCVAVAVLGLVAPEPPRLAQLGFLVVAGFLLVNKVYSPQYVLWLLPLAVLAHPRWRALLVWQAGEVVYFWMVWAYLGGYLDAGTGGAPLYDFAIWVRLAAQLFLVAVVVREVLRPERDPVRTDEVWDPPREPALS